MITFRRQVAMWTMKDGNIDDPKYEDLLIPSNCLQYSVIQV